MRSQVVSGSYSIIVLVGLLFNVNLVIDQQNLFVGNARKWNCHTLLNELIALGMLSDMASINRDAGFRPIIPVSISSLIIPIIPIVEERALQMQNCKNNIYLSGFELGIQCTIIHLTRYIINGCAFWQMVRCQPYLSPVLL